MYKIRSKRQTICVLQNSIRTIAQFRLCYLRILVKQGYDVYCIAPDDDEQARKSVEETGAYVLAVKPGNLLSTALRMNFRAIKLLISKRSDTVVVSHFIVTAVFMAPALLVAKRAICVVEGIGTAFSDRPFFKKLLQFYLKCSVNRRVFMNQYECEEIGFHGDFVLGGIGVDLEKYKPGEQDSLFPGDHVRLLYVGRLLRDKGIHDLFALMKILEENNILFTMHIVGETYSANSGSVKTAELEQAKKVFGKSLMLHGY